MFRKETPDVSFHGKSEILCQGMWSQAAGAGSQYTCSLQIRCEPGCRPLKEQLRRWCARLALRDEVGRGDPCSFWESFGLAARFATSNNHECCSELGLGVKSRQWNWGDFRVQVQTQTPQTSNASM